jgi:hypothetical protein
MVLTAGSSKKSNCLIGNPRKLPDLSIKREYDLLCSEKDTIALLQSRDPAQSFQFHHPVFVYLDIVERI